MLELKKSFEFPYKVLSLLGLWTVETKNRAFRILYFGYQIWVLAFLIIFINLCFWDLYSVRKDVHKASTNLSATMTVFMQMWKNSQALQKLPDIRQLQKNLSEGLQSVEDEDDRKILRKAAREIKLLSISVLTMGGAVMTGWIASGLLYMTENGIRKLPLPIWVPWDYQEAPYFELALLYQVYGGYLVAFDVLSVNLSIFSTIIQICAEYDVLLKNTKKINGWYKILHRVGPGKKGLSEEENFEVGAMISKIVRHHQKIIQCAEVAENCYVHMMLVQFGGSALLITVVSLDLILVSKEINSRVYTLVIFLTLVTSDIYLFCHFGTRLINKSHQFLNNVYELPWEVMSRRNQKSILIIILKAQRPPRLTIEKFANIDLYSLLKLTKIVYNVLYLLLHLARDR